MMDENRMSVIVQQTVALWHFMMFRRGPMLFGLWVVNRGGGSSVGGWDFGWASHFCSKAVDGLFTIQLASIYVVSVLSSPVDFNDIKGLTHMGWHNAGRKPFNCVFYAESIFRQPLNFNGLPGIGNVCK